MTKTGGEARPTIRLRRPPTKRRLNKRTVDALKPPAAIAGKPAREWVYDTLSPRLAICVWSSGAKVWYWVGRCNGRMMRYKLGAFPEITPEAARKMAVKVSNDVAAGIDPRHERNKKRNEPTLGEVFARYLDEHARVYKAPRSVREDERQFRRYCSNLKARPLSTIRRADVAKLHARLGKRAKFQANRVVAMLNKVFGFATAVEVFDGHNPCAGIKKFREQPRDRFLQADELGRFLDALKLESDDVRDYFLLCLWTGARGDNVRHMKWADIELERAEWRIPSTKTGQPQTIYLHAEAVAILRKRREKTESDFVFPARRSDAKEPVIARPYKAWGRVCERAGLHNLRPHDLRRSLGSWMAASGSSLPVIGRTLGHTQPATTAIYARLDLDPVRGAVDCAIGAMTAAANGPAGKKTKTKTGKKRRRDG